MRWRLTKSILIFPGTTLVLIPLAIQYFTGGWPFGATFGSGYLGVLAVVLAVPALYLAIRTMMLFAVEGEGTPAPWDPPQNFVVSGPYRFVRNPMLTSVIVMTLAEALVVGSFPLFIWAGVFLFLNTVYFIRIEEPGLERRFGKQYLDYKAAVPRWLPKTRAYVPTNSG